MSLLRHAGRIQRALSVSRTLHCRIIHPPIRCLIGLSVSRSCFFEAFRRTPVLHSGISTIKPCFYSTFSYSPLQDILLADSEGLRGERDENDELGVGKVIQVVEKAKGFELKSEAIAFLDDSGIVPSQSVVNLAIWELRGSWELALLVFEWGAKLGCNDERTLGLIVWVLDTNDKFTVAWCLIREAHRSSVSIRLPMLIMIER